MNYEEFLREQAISKNARKVFKDEDLDWFYEAVSALSDGNIGSTDLTHHVDFYVETFDYPVEKMNYFKVSDSVLGFAIACMVDKAMESLTPGDYNPITAQYLCAKKTLTDRYPLSCLYSLEHPKEDVIALLASCMIGQSRYINAGICSGAMMLYFGKSTRNSQVFTERFSYYLKELGIEKTPEEAMQAIMEIPDWLTDRNKNLITLMGKNPKVMQWFVNMNKKTARDEPLVITLCGNSETANLARDNVHTLLSALILCANSGVSQDDQIKIAHKVGMIICRDKYEDYDFTLAINFLTKFKDKEIQFLALFCGKKDPDNTSHIRTFVESHGINEFASTTIKRSQSNTVIKNKLLAMICEIDQSTRAKHMRKAIEKDMDI